MSRFSSYGPSDSLQNTLVLHSEVEAHPFLLGAGALALLRFGALGLRVGDFQRLRICGSRPPSSGTTLGGVALVITSRPKKESQLSLTVLPATSAYTPTALGDGAKRPVSPPGGNFNLA